MSHLDKILGQDQAADAEAACVDAFVKQASAEGIDLSQVADEAINASYVAYREKWAEAQVGVDTADSMIEKAAAEGASDEMLEKLALAKLSGEAMFEGYREAWEKFAQEQAAGEAVAAPEVVGGEGSGEPGEGAEAPDVTEEEAQAIVEDAAQEAVEEAAEAAPPDAAPEDIAAAAAEVVPEKVEEKVSELLEYKYAELAKQAGGPIWESAKGVGRALKVRGAEFAAKHQKATKWGKRGGVAALGAGGALAAAHALKKRKEASDILAEMLLEKEAGPNTHLMADHLRGAVGAARQAGREFVKRNPGVAKWGKRGGVAAAGAGTALGAMALAKKMRERK